MKDRNFVKEIEKLRTAVLGYDREEVVLYIRELVEYYGQKNEEAVRELYLEKMQLAAENAGLRAQIPTQEKLYAEAEGKAEEILGGAKETAATILDHAGAEKERMLKEAEEAGKKILAEADQKAVETITEADQKAGETLTEAERKAGEILAEAGRQAEEILAEAGRQMDVILTKTREKVEKQQALEYSPIKLTLRCGFLSLSQMDFLATSSKCSDAIVIDVSMASCIVSSLQGLLSVVIKGISG